jgi:hypothetical protein
MPQLAHACVCANNGVNYAKNSFLRIGPIGNDIYLKKQNL